ncbi:MAG TPA: N-formylglutamate amidohydrolase [Pirellulales bacterium]|nr:N-formylglutamate amidohydrolase [Pirellulales bacterium]
MALALLFLATGRGRAEGDATPAVANPLVTVQQGDLPIVISAPHGGRDAIPDCPPRKGRDGIYRFVTEADTNTGELADRFAAELERKLGKKPYLVRARFARKYCDVNRKPEDAYESPAAKAVYDAYHAALAAACRDVQRRWHGGLLLDIHGQSTYPDKLIRGTQNGLTISMLTERRGAEAYMGRSSLLGLMEAAGYEVLPKLDTTEREPERYAGGHIVRTYGSHQAGGIDAMQFEFGRQYRVPLTEAEKSADDLAEAVAEFCADYVPAAVSESAAAGK